jgi:hypothetical protein
MAKSRRDWSQLSPAYRSRLTRGGITQSEYESGANLSKARGHEKTPEHPKDAVKDKVRYREYLKSTKRLAREVIKRKERLFGGRFKWHQGRAAEYVMSGGIGVPVPGRTQLMKAVGLSDQEFEEYCAMQTDDDWRFLWYH